MYREQGGEIPLSAPFVTSASGFKERETGEKQTELVSTH